MYLVQFCILHCNAIVTHINQASSSSLRLLSSSILFSLEELEKKWKTATVTLQFHWKKVIARTWKIPSNWNEKKNFKWASDLHRHRIGMRSKNEAIEKQSKKIIGKKNNTKITTAAGDGKKADRQFGSLLALVFGTKRMQTHASSTKRFTFFLCVFLAAVVFMNHGWVCIEPDKKKKRRIIKPSVDLVCHIAGYCSQISLSLCVYIVDTVTAQLQIKNKINLISKRVEFIDWPTISWASSSHRQFACNYCFLIFRKCSIEERKTVAHSLHQWSWKFIGM